jgi:hypothetical protein
MSPESHYRAQQFTAIGSTKFVQPPVFALWGFSQATFTSSAIQAGGLDPPLECPQNVPIWFAILVKD